MVKEVAAPAVAGLAIGLSFVVLFSIFFTSRLPFYPISDMKLQKNMEETKEVKALLSKYPDANVQFHLGGDGRRSIDYRAFTDVFLRGEGNGYISHMLTLNIEVQPVTGQVIQMALTCSISEGINDSIQNTVYEDIEAEIVKGECLDV